MTAKIVSVFLIGAAIVASIWAHPMKKANMKGHLAGTVRSKEMPIKLHEQEKELEDLAKLQKDKVNNAMVQTSSDVKIVENNGKSEKTLKITNKVVDGSNGKVLSSVKKIRKLGVSKGGKPKVVAETEVYIPAEGIHDTFHDNLFENEGQEMKNAAFKKSLPETAAFEGSLVKNNPENDIRDLIKSSESIAKYLLETGRFDKLDQSLRDVVRYGLMSKTEASEYKKMVLEYYEKLVELREAEELQSKLNAPPMGYAEQDYGIPFNTGGDRLDNRIYPYGQVDSDSVDSVDSDSVDSSSRYEDASEDSYPIETSINSQPEYVDISDDTVQQPYNRFSDMKQELVPINRDEESQQTSDWLTGLLGQANYGGYPEAESSLNTISDSQPTSRAEREKIQRIIESVLARNALKNSEESSEAENEEETEAAAAAEEEEEEEEEREERLRQRLLLRNRINGRLLRRKVEPRALSKKSPIQSSEQRDKKAEIKKQDAESKRKSA